MKLDLNAAWDSAVKLVKGNREMILVLGGVFFFLPYVLYSLLVPMDQIAAAAASGQEAALMASLEAFAAQYWWAILLLLLIQTVGATAIMAVIGDPARPTVNEAISRGFRLLPSQAGVLVIMFVAMVIVQTIFLAFGAIGGSESLATVFVLLSLPVLLYLVTRFSLAGPDIAIERVKNPIAAIRRSFQLTTGNAFRLLAYYALLTIAFLVVGQVIALIVGALAALTGATVADIIDALLSGVLNTAYLITIYAALAAVHRQLAQAARVNARERMS